MRRTLSSMLHGSAIPEQIVPSQADAMTEQIAQANIAIGERIVQAEPGKCLRTGSSQSALPSSTRIARAVAVNALVQEPMREQSVRRHRLVAAELATPTFGEEDDLDRPGRWRRRCRERARPCSDSQRMPSIAASIGRCRAAADIAQDRTQDEQERAGRAVLHDNPWFQRWEASASSAPAHTPLASLL